MGAVHSLTLAEGQEHLQRVVCAWGPGQSLRQARGSTPHVRFRVAGGRQSSVATGWEGGQSHGSVDTDSVWDDETVVEPDSGVALGH